MQNLNTTGVKVFTISAYSTSSRLRCTFLTSITGFCGLTSSNESTYYRFLDAEYGTHSSSVTVKTNDGRLNAKGEAVSPPACRLNFIDTHSNASQLRLFLVTFSI